MAASPVAVKRSAMWYPDTTCADGTPQTEGRARSLAKIPVRTRHVRNGRGASRGGMAPAPALHEADLTGRATSGLAARAADVSLNLACQMAGRNRISARPPGTGSLCRSPRFGKPIRIVRHNPI